MSQPLLSVDDLHTRFTTHEGIVHAVNGVSFEVHEGEIVGMVGETGSGKSVTAHSIIRLEDPGRITGGSIEFRGTEMTTADERTIRRIRGGGMGMVFQDPESTLNPTFTVTEQIAESLKIHDDPDTPQLLDYLHVPGFSNRPDWRDKRQRAIDLMGEVGIPHPEERADAYPHQFSGGMRQRAMLAIALAREPDLLIADEPTSSLDVTIQAQILDLLQQLNENLGMSILVITHDLGVVAELCDRVIVVDGGEIMEIGTTDQIMTDPRHPYTRGLLECMPQTAPRKQRLNTIEGEVPDLVGEMDGCPFAPRCAYAAEECRTGDIPMVDVGAGQRAKCCRLDTVERDWERERVGRPQQPYASGTSSGSEPAQPVRRDGETPVLEVENLSKQFTQNDSLLDQLFGDREYVQAVNGVSLSLYEGETLGLVGESGSGKSTLANVIAGLYTPTSGEVRFDGDPVGRATDRPTELLSDVGMVFQNPKNSLDPRMQLKEVIAEPLRIQGWEKERREARISELADLVELSGPLLRRYPHEVSGGQAQRAAVARAVALDPSVVLLDEPVSALDVSVQAKILNLLMDLQAELDLTYLLIAHDLSVVGHMSDRVAVMYLGRIMELAPTHQLFESPTHPYTEALLSAILDVDPTVQTDGRIILEGDVPSPVNPPSGCVFHTRCPVVIPPEDWPGEQPAFEAAFTFRNRVLSGDVDPDAIRKQLHARAELSDEVSDEQIGEEPETPREGLVAAASSVRNRLGAAAASVRNRLGAAAASVRNRLGAATVRVRTRLILAAVALREHVLPGTIDRESTRQRVQAMRETSDDDAVAAEIVEEALPGDVSDLPDEAAERIEDAAEALAAGEDDRAREIVREAFPSPCERQVPRFVETDAGHIVACHWSDPEVRREPVDAAPSRPRSYGG